LPLFSLKIDKFAFMNEPFDIKRIERISKALGDPYRLKIMEVITKEHDWMQCSTIVERFDLAQSTVSHHLKQLVDADLLLAEKDGRKCKYLVNKDVVNGYVKFLSKYNG